MTVAQQTHLPLSRHANPVPVTADMVERQDSMLAAIRLCVSLSGLEDNEVALALDIQAAQWSRILAGTAHMPPNKIGDLMDLCGNEAPLLWLANARGYGLHLLKSEAERQRDEAQNELAAKERENALLRDLLMRRPA